MSKFKKKKNLILIICLLLVTVVGVTFALLYTNNSLPNIFGLGNYNVVTSETFTSPASWQPGVEIPKSITATNNGNIQAAFRVKYTEQWLDSNNNDITATVPDDTVSINFINNHDWSYNPIDGYYYYNWIIDSGDTTSSLISGITLNQDLTGSANCVEDGNTYNCSSSLGGLAGASYILTFTKETVVYSKYQSFWWTNQEIGEYVPLYTLPEGRTAYNLQIGDEVCINGATSECFNFIGYDENNIKLLSKYNLKVGKIYDSLGTETGTYSSSDTGYGLQNSEARGYVPGQTRYGTVAFSATNYWYDGSNLRSKYGSAWNTNNVYDTYYKREPNFSLTGFETPGYSIAYYVEEYKNKLEDYGATINDARLLTYSEATSSSIGCSGSSCPNNGFIRNTSFWLGSAISSDRLWGVHSYGDFYDDGYSYDDIRGVRPVIVLSKSDVNNNVDDENKFHIVSLPNDRTKDTLQVGDEICINGDTTECFNFIRYDGDNAVMLSKWNLKVGNIRDSSRTKIGEYTSSTSGYGLQSSEAKGWVSGETGYGTVAFSNTNYWYDGDTLKLKYGSSVDDSNIYDADYNAASGNNYSVAYYVENYKDILENYGLIIQDTRLLTFREATINVGCGGTSCPSGFIRNTTFWVGSASSGSIYVYHIDTKGSFVDYWYSDNLDYGVRPVIVINKNDL